VIISLSANHDYLKTLYKAVVTTAIQTRLYSHSTAIPPCYDHSTTYVTTGLLHCGLSKQAVGGRPPRYASAPLQVDSIFVFIRQVAVLFRHVGYLRHRPQVGL